MQSTQPKKITISSQLIDIDMFHASETKKLMREVNLIIRTKLKMVAEK